MGGSRAGLHPVPSRLRRCSVGHPPLSRPWMHTMVAQAAVAAVGAGSPWRGLRRFITLNTVNTRRANEQASRQASLTRSIQRRADALPWAARGAGAAAIQRQQVEQVDIQHALHRYVPLLQQWAGQAAAWCQHTAGSPSSQTCMCWGMRCIRAQTLAPVWMGGLHAPLHCGPLHRSPPGRPAPAPGPAASPDGAAAAAPAQRCTHRGGIGCVGRMGGV